MKRIILMAAGCVIGLLFSRSYAQVNYGTYKLYSSYSFNQNAADSLGNDSLILHNVKFINDPVRGKVASISMSDTGYMEFYRPPFNTDTFTIAMWFYWDSSNGSEMWQTVFDFINSANSKYYFYLTPSGGWAPNINAMLVGYDSANWVNFNVGTTNLAQNTWMHLCVSIQDRDVKVYLNGNQAASGTLNATPERIRADRYFLGSIGAAAYRNMTARFDDLKIFHEALYPNQVMALAKDQPVPAPTEIIKDVTINIDFLSKQQQIRNFGASDAWNTESVGKYWPEEKKQRLAEMLFSSDSDAFGNPKGIALSAWRFTIGCGSAEQGDSSGVQSGYYSRREECFLNADGTYNWNKQLGSQYFLKKARDYGVSDIIGFTIGPPVLYNYNHLAFKTNTDGHTNLMASKYRAYGDFLANVVSHFADSGIIIKYISPVNEPQWPWNATFDQATQSGSSWTNEEIASVVKSIDSSFTAFNLSSKIFLSETGMLTELYGGSTLASNQLYKFWNPVSPDYLLNLPHMSKLVSAHSYFTENNATEFVLVRKTVASDISLLDKTLEYWQTEYCLLGDAFREGQGTRSTIDCALWLARIIHNDLTMGNATAWQFWTAFERDNPDFDTRFLLISVVPDSTGKDGNFKDAKTLWSLGNFSRFVRPGMYRVGTTRSDNLADEAAANSLMVSSYIDSSGKLVVVAVNYDYITQRVKFNLANFPLKRIPISVKSYVTSSSETENLAYHLADSIANGILIKPRTIVTFVADLNFIPLKVQTSITQSVTTRSAYLNGILMSYGSSSQIKEIGFVYDTAALPTLKNARIPMTVAFGNFRTKVDSLEFFTKYHYRAYAISLTDTMYGDVLSFTTLNAFVYSKMISNLSSNSVTLNGQLQTNNYPGIVKELGFCYGVSLNPTIDSNKVLVNVAEGLYGASISGLQSGGKYYFRAYAITTQNVVIYGSNVVFTTTANGIAEILNSLSVYPNPASGEIHIEFNAYTATDLRLINAAGAEQQVSFTKKENSCSANISHLPPGLYLLVMKINNEVITKSIIKN